MRYGHGKNPSLPPPVESLTHRQRAQNWVLRALPLSVSCWLWDRGFPPTITHEQNQELIEMLGEVLSQDPEKKEEVDQPSGL